MLAAKRIIQHAVNNVLSATIKLDRLSTLLNLNVYMLTTALVS